MAVLFVRGRPQVCLTENQQKEAHAPTNLFAFGEGQTIYGGNMLVVLDTLLSQGRQLPTSTAVEH